MTSEVDTDAVVRMVKDIMALVEGEDVCDALSAVACVATEILSSQPSTKDEALILFNTAIMTISVNMEQRMSSGQCSWQSFKQ